MNKAKKRSIFSFAQRESVEKKFVRKVGSDMILYTDKFFPFSRCEKTPNLEVLVFSGRNTKSYS